jgi:hypothetical protein
MLVRILLIERQTHKANVEFGWCFTKKDFKRKVTNQFNSSLSMKDETLFSETTTVAQDTRIGYLCVHASLIFAFGCPVPLLLHTAFNGFLNCDQCSTVKGIVEKYF